MEWVIVSNSNNCRIFEYSKRPRNLELLKELRFPSARKKGLDLASDRPGRYTTPTTTRGTYVGHSDVKEVEVEKFAIKVARVIEEGRKKKSYHKLTIFAPAHMTGLINKHMPDSLQNFANTIKKDYTHLNESQILVLLKPIEIAKPNKRKTSSAKISV